MAKVLIEFTDKFDRKRYYVGSEYSASKERMEHLQSRGIISITEKVEIKQSAEKKEVKIPAKKSN